MTRYIACILIGILTAVAVAVAAEPASKPATRPSGWGVKHVVVGGEKQPHVLLIGDSILGGYNAYAAKALIGHVSLDALVTPKHIGSDIARDLESLFKERQYDVILFNDIGLHAWSPGRIKDGQYEPLTRAHVANLRRLAPNAKLIFATTTPMTTKTKPIELDPEFNPLIISRNEIAKKVMAENQIPVADYYAIVVDKLQLAAGDRFHWTRPAYELLGAEAAKQISEALNIVLPPSASPSEKK